MGGDMGRVVFRARRFIWNWKQRVVSSFCASENQFPRSGEQFQVEKRLSEVRDKVFHLHAGFQRPPVFIPDNLLFLRGEAEQAHSERGGGIFCIRLGFLGGLLEGMSKRLVAGALRGDDAEGVLGFIQRGFLWESQSPLFYLQARLKRNVPKAQGAGLTVLWQPSGRFWGRLVFQKERPEGLGAGLNVLRQPSGRFQKLLKRGNRYA